MSKITRVILQWLLAFFLLGIGVYYWDLSDVLRLSVVHWYAVGLVFFFTACFTLMHNIRWMKVLTVLSPRFLRKEMDFLQYYRWLLNSYAVGLFVPSDVSLVGLRTFYMKKYEEVNTSTAFFSVLVDRFFDVIVLFTVLVSAFLVFIGNNRMEMILMPVVLVGLVFLFLLWKNEEIFGFLIKTYFLSIKLVLKIPFLRKWRKFETIESFPYTTLKRNTVCGLMAYSFLKYVFIALRFYCIGLTFGVTFTFFEAFFAASLVQLTGFINITPGGLGVMEIGSYGALKVIGASNPEAVVFVVGQRVLTFCTIIVLTVIINLLMITRTKNLRKESY